MIFSWQFPRRAGGRTLTWRSRSAFWAPWPWNNVPTVSTSPGSDPEPQQRGVSQDTTNEATRETAKKKRTVCLIWHRHAGRMHAPEWGWVLRVVVCPHLSVCSSFLSLKPRNSAVASNEASLLRRSKAHTWQRYPAALVNSAGGRMTACLLFFGFFFCC